LPDRASLTPPGEPHAGPQSPQSGDRFPALRPFQSRNYRIYYLGQFVMVLGNWMQNVAMSWLVYRLSGSALALGITAFAQQLPVLLLAPFAGVLADRTNRRRVLIIVQSFGLVQGAAITLLTVSGQAQVWHIIVLSLWIGVVNGFETPTRQAFLLELLRERHHLPNAIALQSFLMNTTRLVGPSLAGVILAFFGEAVCFAINTICYVAIVAAYRIIRPPARTIRTDGQSWFAALIVGFRYAFGDRVNRRLMALLGCLGFMSAPWQSLMPIIAKQVLQGDSRTLGGLIGAVGAGALISTVFIASRRTVRGIEKTVLVTIFVTALSFIGFSFARTFLAAALLLPVFGFGLIATASSSNQILQSIAHDDFRGRIVSVYVMVFMGSMPLGNLLGGVVADHFGALWTVRLAGIGLLGLALWFMAGFRAFEMALAERFRARGIGSAA
jgi:MFS family permease